MTTAFVEEPRTLAGISVEDVEYYEFLKECGRQFLTGDDSAIYRAIPNLDGQLFKRLDA